MHAVYLPQPSITVACTAAALAAIGRKRKTALAGLAAGSYVELDASQFNRGALEMVEVSDGSENDSNVVNVYACRGADGDYSLVGTVTGAQGTQTYHGKTDEFYADTLTVTQVDAGLNMREASTAANNICKVRFNDMGYSHFLFIATTLATDTLKLLFAPIDYGVLATQGPWAAV